MQALSDEQQSERLEKRVDDGFAEVRAEFRALRGEVTGLSHAIYGLFAMLILGFAAILLQHHL